MSILDTIFDAGARRRKKLADLVAAREQLQAAYDDAIATGADIDKPQASLAKHDAAIAAAQAVVDATEAATAKAKQADKLSARDQAERDAIDAFEELASAGIDFEELVAELDARWGRVETAQHVAYQTERKAQLLGSAIRTVTMQNVAAGDIWTRVWMNFLRRVQKGGGVLRLFPSTPGQYAHESAAAVLERELAHHRKAIKEPTQ